MNKGLKTFTEETIIELSLEELKGMHLDVQRIKEGVTVVRTLPMPPIKTNEL